MWLWMCDCVRCLHNYSTMNDTSTSASPHCDVDSPFLYAYYFTISSFNDYHLFVLHMAVFHPHIALSSMSLYQRTLAATALLRQHVSLVDYVRLLLIFCRPHVARQFYIFFIKILHVILFTFLPIHRVLIVI
jgi:hypothetical protein